ncbi:MAG: tRNA uracil 4-sulfurtransferase ThiI [Spirochaetaceae bacterium]
MISVNYDVLLLSYAEIGIKGRNRYKFEDRMERVLQHVLEHAGRPWPVERRHRRMQVLIPEKASPDEVEEVIAVIRRLAGFVRIYPAIRVMRNGRGNAGGGKRDRSDAAQLQAIGERLLTLAVETHEPHARFAVRAERRDRGFGITSEEMERYLGREIIEHTPWESVQLKNPDVTYKVDVYPDCVYLSMEGLRGVGGLPVGMSGRVVSLLSGGLDSPVAAYLMAKRGCEVDMVHMCSSDPRNRDDPQVRKILHIAEHTSRYTLRSELFMLPYAPFDMELFGFKTNYQVVIFRRFLLRLASHIARARGIQALCLGESLAQVASQTYENLVTISHAVDDTIFRPLITYDKSEIVELARRIGTFDLSTIPDKDCCALIQANPRTKSTAKTVERIEARVLPDMEGLIERTLAEGVVVRLDTGEIVDFDTDVKAALERPPFRVPDNWAGAGR